MENAGLFAGFMALAFCIGAIAAIFYSVQFIIQILSKIFNVEQSSIIMIFAGLFVSAGIFVLLFQYFLFGLLLLSSGLFIFFVLTKEGYA